MTNVIMKSMKSLLVIRKTINSEEESHFFEGIVYAMNKLKLRNLLHALIRRITNLNHISWIRSHSWKMN